jgi:electron transport complex protein RnfC
VQYYRASKTDIKQREIDHHNAELAKRRFDARQDRLIRLEQEKNAAKQARQAARKKTSPPNEKLPTASASAANADAPATTVKAEHDATVKAAIERTKIKKATLSEATDDPVARAQAKREAQLAQDQSDPEAKLRRALESAQQRLEKLQVKLAAAKDSDDPNVNILEAGLEKAQSKLLSSQQALDDYKNASLSND